ncbi:MAG: hypothetical protein IPJ48_02840 [Propionivibrio sp.]|uniref:Uncharacterized protein n=1 Tax=Candidatus Propionivibrio dominans TaxID=2954373 RepID=A0A9D7F4Y2_9RHOO|nr:hypothetical protein [Candidatus Propionivibrio dominans]
MRFALVFRVPVGAGRPPASPLLGRGRGGPPLLAAAAGGAAGRVSPSASRCVLAGARRGSRVRGLASVSGRAGLGWLVPCGRSRRGLAACCSALAKAWSIVTQGGGGGAPTAPPGGGGVPPSFFGGGGGPPGGGGGPKGRGAPGGVRGPPGEKGGGGGVVPGGGGGGRKGGQW